MSGSENVYGYILHRPMLSTFEHQLPIIECIVFGLKLNICHLHAKLIVITYILKIFTVSCHTTVFCESYLYGAMFFQVLMYEQCTGFSYSLYTHSLVMCLISIQYCILA